MKKFLFSLDKVLNFKRQMEDSLRIEHAEAVRAVRQKEKIIERMEEVGSQYVSGLKEAQRDGCTIEDLRIYQNYLGSVRQRICEEKEALQILNQKEEEKRAEVIEAKKERASIDILKDKKKHEYNGLVQKEEERFIEEFVSNTMSCKGDPA